MGVQWTTLHHLGISIGHPLDCPGYTCTYIHTLHYITLHYTTLHCIALHYITLHYITFIYIHIAYIYIYIILYLILCILYVHLLQIGGCQWIHPSPATSFAFRSRLACLILQAFQDFSTSQLSRPSPLHVNHLVFFARGARASFGSKARAVPTVFTCGGPCCFTSAV